MVSTQPKERWPVGEPWHRVTLVERLGHDTILRVNVPDAGALTVSLDGQHAHQVGDILHMRPRLEFIHRFDEAGRPVAG